MNERNLDNLSPGWLHQGNRPLSCYCGDEDEYLRLFDKHFKGFSGTVLEIGPGTAYLCKHIMKNYDVDYTILDIEKNIYEIKQMYITKKQAQKIQFINSKNYEDVFQREYDLLVSTFCLPETPPYYWKSIFDDIRVKNCFVIDDGKWCDYEIERNQWLYKNFNSCEETQLIYTLKGYKEKGIQLSIGKNKIKEEI